MTYLDHIEAASRELARAERAPRIGWLQDHWAAQAIRALTEAIVIGDRDMMLAHDWRDRLLVTLRASTPNIEPIAAEISAYLRENGR